MAVFCRAALEMPITVDPGVAKITLSWPSVGSGGTYYYVLEKKGSGGTPIYQHSIKTNWSGGTHVDTIIQNAYAYHYRITAYAQQAPYEIYQSPWVTSKTELPAPRMVWHEDDGYGNFTVKWTASPGADYYVVHRGINAEPTSNIGSSVTTSMNVGYIAPHQRNRTFAVYAFNNAGPSPRSPVTLMAGATWYPSTAGAKPPFDFSRALYPSLPRHYYDPLTGATAPALATGPGPVDSGDPVNLASGQEEYNPEPDLYAYNPNGVSARFHRIYSSDAVLSKLPPAVGLSEGWSHNYDAVVLNRVDGTSWNPLKLVYPGGAVQNFTPVLSGSTPTGNFTVPAGSPFIVTGTPGSSTGVWDDLTITWSDQTKWVFEPHSLGNLVLARIENRLGQSITLVWGAIRELLSVADTASSVNLLTFNYDSNGQIQYVTDNNGRRVYYTFNGSIAYGLSGSYLSGHSIIVPSTTPLSGAQLQTQYDYVSYSGSPLLSKVSRINPAGAGMSSMTLEWGWVSALGRWGCTRRTDANGNKTEFTYSTTETLVTIKNFAGSSVLAFTQLFDSSKRDKGRRDALGNVHAITYGDTNNPSKPTLITSPSGLTVSMAYDSYGHLTSATNALGITTTYSYDYSNFALGRLVSVQRASDPPVTTTYYEPQGLVQSVTAPSPTGSGTVSSTYTYDSLGNTLTVTTPGLTVGTTRTTTANYTTDGSYSQAAAVGQPLVVTNNAGEKVHFRYDAYGRITQSWDNVGNLTQTQFNLAGQPTLTLYPEASLGSGHISLVTEYLYVGGPVTASRLYDELGALHRETTFTYGPEGETLAKSGALQTENFVYDAAYRTTAITDALGRTTTYAYNSIGQLANATYPGGDQTQFTAYDSDHRPVSQTNPSGQVINTTYNSLGQVTAVTYPGATAFNASYSYDSYGRMTSVTDAAGSRSMTYDSLDQTLSVTTTFPGLSAKVQSYSFHADGSRDTITTPAGNFAYGYDSAGRLASVTNPNSETTSITLDSNGWIDSLNLANGASTTYDHDGLGRLTHLENFGPGPVTHSEYSSFSYDPSANLTALTVSVPAFSAFSGTSNWSFDNKDRILGETSSRYGGYSHTFGHDSVGNLTNWFGSTRTFNVKNQLVAAGFTYNADGDPTTYAGQTAAYSPTGGLLTLGSAYAAQYYSSGLRAWKDGSAGRTYYLYEGTTPIVELDASGNVSAYNTFAPGGLASRRSGSVSTFYQFDYRGGTAHRLDSSGAVLTSHLYDAYGGMASSAATTDPWANFNAQTGYQRDPETNLLLAGFRYYDPAQGLWLNRDPIGYHGGLNLYQYCQGNPQTGTDPLGLFNLNWAQDLENSSNGSLGKIAGKDPFPPVFRFAAFNPYATTHFLNDKLTLPARTSRIGSNTGEKGGWGFLEDVGTALEWFDFIGISSFAKPSTSAGTKIVGEIAETTAAKNFAGPGVYEFIAKDGTLYVGQSNNIARRLQEHIRSGKLLSSELDNVTHHAMEGSTSLQRRIEEQIRINRYKLGNLSNARNSIAEKYWNQYGIPPPGP